MRNCAAPAAQTPSSFQLENIIETAECPFLAHFGHLLRDRATARSGGNQLSRRLSRLCGLVHHGSPGGYADHGLKSSSRPISARPKATDWKFSPSVNRCAPNRVSNTRRTAGMNELPPIRNTLSISSNGTPSDCSSWSTAFSMLAMSPAIQRSKSRREISCSILSSPSLSANVAVAAEDSRTLVSETARYVEAPIVADDVEKHRDLMGG